MRLKYALEAVDMGDEIILVPVGNDADTVSGVLKVNKEAHEIVKLLEEKENESGIIDSLSSRYENDVETLSQYVHRIIETLRKSGLFEE